MRISIMGLAAILVAAATMLPVLAAPPERQAQLAVAQQAGPQQYVLSLRGKTVKTPALKAELARAVPGATLSWHSRRWPDLAVVRAPAGSEAALAGLASVATVQIERPAPAATAAKAKSAGAVRAKDAAVLPPLSDDPNAGQGMRVAIISTGIDYTHAEFGGAGTAEAYADAFANAAAPYDGFPTDLVVAGYDFIGDSASLAADKNPIDAALDLNGFPRGRGTYLASIVHRLAPAAKLVALKVFSVFRVNSDQNDGRAPGLEQYGRAFEAALDPNLDGDDSDRVDVILLDEALGSFAYYLPGSSSPSPDAHLANFVADAAARGIAVVTTSGQRIIDSPYSIAVVASVPDGIAVGGVERVGDADAMLPFSGRGPVRGSASFLKPDMVSYAADVEGATAGGGDASEVRTGLEAAAARVAAAYAILKAQRPGLSMLELKAALVNTGTRDARKSAEAPTVVADVSSGGLGRENPAAAQATPVVAWDEDNHQPSMFFGFHEVSGSQRLVRHLHVRNLSDQDASYTLAVQRVGETKPGHAAVSFELPATVQVPARRSVSVPVVVTIDGSKLPAWTQRQSGEFTAEKWSQAELSGYFVLARTGAPEVAVSWLLMARPKTSIVKMSETLSEQFSSKFWVEYLGIDQTLELSQSFRSLNTTPVDFETFPVLARVDAIPYGWQHTGGHAIRYVGAKVSDEALCTAGKKLAIATTLWHPASVALANYFEKIGTPIVYWEIRPDTGSGVTSEYIGYGWVEPDIDGQPITISIDLSKEYDPNNPTGRYRVSKLPAKMASHTRNIVSEVCLEDFFHEDVDGVEDFDAQLNWVISTDRDVLPRSQQDVWFRPLLYNPVHPHYDALFGHPDAEPVDYVQRVQAQPGVAVGLTAAKLDSFGFPGIPSYPNPLLDTDSFLLLGMNDDFVMYSKVGYDTENSVAAPRATTLSVREDAPAGTVVARIDTDVEEYFGTGFDNDYYFVKLVSAVPGDPFTLSPDGVLTVTNPAGLDHELSPTLTLQVQGRYGENGALSAVSEIEVLVTDVNDNAPRWLGGIDALPDAATKTPYQVALGSRFDDGDGDALVFTATGLPAGLAIDAASGAIGGTPTADGDFSVVVKATDTVGEASKTLPLKVRNTDVVHKDGGGAWSTLALLVLAGAALLRRLRAPLRTLLAVLLLGAFATPLQAAEEPAGAQPRSTAPLVQKNVASRLRDAQGRQLYFVNFQDAPLASYAGGKSGLAATSLAATAGRNAGPRGTLDVKSARSQSYLSFLQRQQTSALQAASRSLSRTLSPQHSFRTALNAVTVYLSQGEAKRLRTLPQVSFVEAVTLRQVDTDRGPGLIGAPLVWNGDTGFKETQGEGVIVGIIDTGISPANAAFADIGGDGYDHTNPLGENVYLGDCIARADLCNDKLIGIWSVPELAAIHAEYGGEPYGIDYDGHGSHVASTVAGNVELEVPVYSTGVLAQQTFTRISGVAPHANIVAYQVCIAGTEHEYSGCYPDATAMAVEHAIANGLRVLNYSIGGPANSPWRTIDAMAFLSAREAGIHVATSAGNTGPDPETVRSPGNAPWLTSVAASTHDRAYSAKSVGAFSGGSAPPAAAIAGKGVSGGYTGAVVYAGDFGDALCLYPFAQATFDGQIVICDRGENARVQKGANVLAGGAGGMILVNIDAATDNVVEDFHALPAIHVAKADGEAIKAWLAAGSGHAATISVSASAPDANAADRVADFSSRGPATPYAAWIKPDLAAPGVNIYAAYSEFQLFQDSLTVFPSPYTFLSGTSMASPHVAGVLTLIAALHPDWTPAEAQSALVGTALPGLRLETSDDAAGFYDAGNGRVRAAEAVKATLVLDETAANYLAAEPAQGAEPLPLNLPSLVNDNCLIECSWTRTVRATRDGTWTAAGVPAAAGVAIDVLPANFSLAAGESRTLTVTLRSTGEMPSQAAFGSVDFKPIDLSLPLTRLPLSAIVRTTSVPPYTRIETRSGAGTDRIEGLYAGTSSSAQYTLRGWVIGTRYAASLQPDPTPDDFAFDSPDSLQTVPIDITSSTRLLVARVSKATAKDLDLFIGQDANLNGRVDVGETFGPMLCMSADEDADEECMLVSPTPGSYWIAVHHYEGSGAASDTHELLVAQLKDNLREGGSIAGPAQTTLGEAFGIDVGWELPLVSEDSAFALYSVRTVAGQPDDGPYGIVELARLRDALAVSSDATEVMSGTDVTYTLQIDAGAATVIDLDLPVPLTVVSAEGAPTIEGSQLRWNVPAGSSATTLDLVVGTAAVQQTQTTTLAFEYRLGAEDAVGVSAPAVLIEGYPQARIDNQAARTLAAAHGDVLALTTTGSTGAREGDTLSYTWLQVAGPAVPITAATAGGYSLSVPEAAAGATLRYELRAGNGRRESQPATLTVNVAEKSGGGGGAWSLAGLLPLLLMVLVRRRFNVRRSSRVGC